MTAKTDKAQFARQQPAFWQMRWKTAILLIVLLLLLWVGLKAWRIGRAANSLLSQQETAQLLLADGLSNIDPDTAESMIQTIRQDVVVLRDETAFLLPFASRLGWVPKAGPLLVSAPQLMEMADAGSETAVYAIESLKPLLVILQTEQSSESQLPQLIHALAEARPGLTQASLSLDKVAQARANIHNLDQFPERLKPLFAQADEWLPVAQDSLAFVQILPDVMGQNGQRTYLLLAQNEDEIRATGGFISGVGTVTIENGEIQSLSFQDASTYDIETLLANSGGYSYPPQPLYELMGSEYLLLRDANYWPDFPYSAQKAIELYQKVTPEAQIDGVFAIDQQFMALLVAATGPITVQDNQSVIIADNTIDSFRNAFNIKEGQTTGEWFQNRKAFLSTFSSAIITKIESDFAAIEPITLIKNMHFALSARHLQMYLTDLEETAVLENLNWDGRLENPGKQDFLLVLDTNMGFNKTNMHIQRTYAYNVELNPNGQSEADLTISYTHTNTPSSDSTCNQGTSYANAPSYQEIADRCYFNFLRVYTPPNSTLINATHHTVPANILISGSAWDKPADTAIEFANFTTFSNFLMVPQGETLTTNIHYSLPQTIIREENNQYIYNLWLRKQASTSAENISATISLPADSTILSTTATNEATIRYEGNAIVEFSLNLQEDTLLTVVFE